jgi:hypothetical protein
MPKNTIASVMTKYDYLLTAHPQAHESEFATKTLKDMNAEVAALTGKMSKEDLHAELELFLNKVPTKEQRDAFTKLMASSSTVEMANFFTKPELMQAALRGESANFALSFSENPEMFVIPTLILGLAIVAIIYAIKNAKYQTFESSYFLECQYLSSGEQEALKESAKQKCLAGATNPETCKLDSFRDETTNYQGGQGGTETYEKTECVATYRALKKVD